MKTVIGVGVSALEDFESFGEVVEAEIDQAVAVIALQPDGDARELKSGDEISVYVFDGAEGALFECLEQIKLAWEESALENGHLGHAAAGMWLFYWIAPDLSSMRQLVRAGRVDDLRAAARSYIEAGFGSQHGPKIAVSS
jgi:hypothetical protein